MTNRLNFFQLANMGHDYYVADGVGGSEADGENEMVVSVKI